MPKVFLETNFFSACVTTRMGPKSQGWRASSREWWATERKHFELFVSTEVIRDLSAPEFRSRNQALMMLEGLTILRPEPSVTEVAEIFVSERVMPKPRLRGTHFTWRWRLSTGLLPKNGAI